MFSRSISDVRIGVEPKGLRRSSRQRCVGPTLVGDLGLRAEVDLTEACNTEIAFQVNRTTQNIGAGRLHTIMERVLGKASFEGPDLSSKQVVINGKYVCGRQEDVLQREDLRPVYPVRPGGLAFSAQAEVE
jgi:hypothetical protein